MLAIDRLQGIVWAFELDNKEVVTGGIFDQGVGTAMRRFAVDAALVAASVGANEDDILDALLRSVQAGNFRYVFRLKTTHILRDYANVWTLDPTALRSIYVTAEGDEIDGRDPKHIEVGFERSNAFGES